MGILTFSILKKIIKIPTPGQKIVVKIVRNKWFTPLLLFELKGQMIDVRSKPPPWGYTSQSNSRGLPEFPPPLSGLRCVICLKSIACHTESLFCGIFFCVRNISALAGSENPQDCICRFSSLNYLLLIHLRNISAVFNSLTMFCKITKHAHCASQPFDESAVSPEDRET